MPFRIRTVGSVSPRAQNTLESLSFHRGSVSRDQRVPSWFGVLPLSPKAHLKPYGEQLSVGERQAHGWLQLDSTSA